jgi:hypothetical protein
MLNARNRISGQVEDISNLVFPMGSLVSPSEFPRASARTPLDISIQALADTARERGGLEDVCSFLSCRELRNLTCMQTVIQDYGKDYGNMDRKSMPL